MNADNHDHDKQSQDGKDEFIAAEMVGSRFTDAATPTRPAPTFKSTAMTATDVLASVKAAGVDISVHGDKLRVAFEGEPPLTLLDEVRTHKAAILALLRAAVTPPPATSAALLLHLGVEVALIENEATAEREIARLLAETEVIGLDIETAPRREHMADSDAALDPLKAEVRLLQIATETRALVVDLRKVCLSSPALIPVWLRTLVGHNLSFDVKMLMANGVDLGAATIIDTILLSGLFLRGEPDRGRGGSRRPSLALAVAEALDIDLPKQMQRSDWSRDELSDEQVVYAALDAVMALRLLARFRADMERQHPGPDGLKLAERLNKAVLPVARMELHGVMLDTGALAKLDAEWRARAKVLREEVRARLGIENRSSAIQIAGWLGNELQRLGKVREWPQTPAGKLSTKAKHLKRLIGQSPNVEMLVELSHLEQLASNFGQSLINRVGADGRLRANFQIAGAKSGRFTSSRPNLQNIPRAEATRSLFVAEPGCALVCADYNQLELRVMAAMSGDAVMTEAYCEGRDLHATTAAGMLAINVENFDKADPAHAEARKKAKAINFGIIFGCGREGLQEFARDEYGVMLTIDEANDLIRRFLETYKGVASWMHRQTERARRLGYVETVGRRRYRFRWESHGWFSRNLALNLPIQGTAAEIAVEAVTRIDARVRRDLPTGKLVLQVHDEFVLEAPQDHVGLAKRILTEEMTAAFAALLPDAPTLGLVDAHAGENWATAKG